MNSGTHGSALLRECVFLILHFRPAWLLKTLETSRPRRRERNRPTGATVLPAAEGHEG